MDEQMELDEALETLRSADKKVSVKSNSDWKEAVINAAKQFEWSGTEILPTVHQEYVIRVENGINFPQSIIDKKREEYAFQLCETAKQQILEGRRFLGEPDNLNF